MASRPLLVLATQNAKKRLELQALVGDRFEVVLLDAVGLGDLQIVEDQETFSGNAWCKVNAVIKALEERGQRYGAVLADDSGLCVDALEGRPGVRSARFAADAGAGEGDEANNAQLIASLMDVPDGERGARYVAVIAMQLADGTVLEARGEVVGSIAREPRGEGGFGYDPYFIPSGQGGRHMAELTADEKAAISHRGRAVRSVLEKLERIAGDATERSG